MPNININRRLIFAPPQAPDASWVPPDGALIWYKADGVKGLSDGGAISTWIDYSGSKNDATSSGTNRPLYRTNVINGLPAVQFDGNLDHYFNVPEFFEGTETAGEVFILVSSANDPGVSPRSIALMYLGSTHADVDLYPFTDGNIYDGCFSTVRKNTGSPFSSLKSFMVYNIRSTNGSYIGNFNGFNYYSTATNTFTRAATNSSMGTQRRIGRAGTASFWFTGYVCEVFVFNRILNAAERQSVWDYLYVKWGLLSTEDFESYALGTANPAGMKGGVGFTEGADISENFVKIVSEESFESYSIGTPTESDLNGGTGWTGTPDVDVNA